MLIENVTHHMDEQEQECFPKDRTAWVAPLQEMGVCLVALGKTAPAAGSTECVEKVVDAVIA